MKLQILGVLLIAFATLGAQPTGTLKIYISPPPETIMIDDTELKFGNTADLKPGKYFLQAWAPNRELLDTIVEIKAGEVVSFYYRLKPARAYMSFQAAEAKYSVERTRNFVLPATAAVISGGALAFTYFKGRQVRNEALSAYDDYYYATSNRDAAAAEFERLQKSYRGYVTAYYIEWGALAVSGYFLYKGIKWLQQNKKPGYKAPQNPLALNGAELSRDPSGNYTIGFTFNLN